MSRYELQLSSLLFCSGRRKSSENVCKETPVSKSAFSLLASAFTSRRNALASFSVLKNRDFCFPALSTTDARQGDFLPGTWVICPLPFFLRSMASTSLLVSIILHLSYDKLDLMSMTWSCYCYANCHENVTILLKILEIHETVKCEKPLQILHLLLFNEPTIKPAFMFPKPRSRVRFPYPAPS